jgi:hypothetical protein
MTTTTRPAAATKPAGSASRGFGSTLRLDRWSLEPVITGLAFTGFVLYSLFSAFILTPSVAGVAYEVDGYLSPFFSPLIFPELLPWWFTPAVLILWIPLGFRTTCYYYRKAYYRAFLFDPPACSVGEPFFHKRYGMEARFPFVLQNLHRLFLYLAFIPLAFLWLDAFISLHHDDHWRFGLGGLILFVNVALLTGYSLSCHSLRHLAGGTLDCFSCSARTRTRYGLWQRVTALNVNHAKWAWASLLSVAGADLYIRLIAIGVIADPAIRF